MYCLGLLAVTACAVAVLEAQARLLDDDQASLLLDEAEPAGPQAEPQPPAGDPCPPDDLSLRPPESPSTEQP